MSIWRIRKGDEPRTIAKLRNAGIAVADLRCNGRSDNDVNGRFAMKPKLRKLCCVEDFCVTLTAIETENCQLTPTVDRERVLIDC